MAEPIRVVITGAAGQIGYSLIYMVGSGYVFGQDQPIILQLLDIPPAMGVLEGVCQSHPGDWHWRGVGGAIVRSCLNVRTIKLIFTKLN